MIILIYYLILFPVCLFAMGSMPLFIYLFIRNIFSSVGIKWPLIYSGLQALCVFLFYCELNSGRHKKYYDDDVIILYVLLGPLIGFIIIFIFNTIRMLYWKNRMKSEKIDLLLTRH